jgi:hypothetical protein
MPFRARFVLSTLLLIATAACILAVAMAIAEVKGRGVGVAAALGPFVVMHLLRVAREWDEGIDFFELMLPAPFDWNTKIERSMLFWRSRQPWFRAVYLGSELGAIIVTAVLISRGAP